MEEIKLNIGFKIIHVDENAKTISVRPNSTSFKKHPESYPLLNINMSNLNSEADVSQQIIEMISPTVKAIIDGENEDKISAIMKFVRENQNKVISADKIFNTPPPITVPPPPNKIQPSTIFEVIST